MSSNVDESDKDGKSSPSTETSSPNKTVPQSKAPPKRAQRQRNPVVLLQHNYYEIYDDKNNRAGKRKKPLTKESSPQQVTKKQANAHCNNTKKRKNSSASSTDKTNSKSSSTEPNAPTNSKSAKSKSIYRWVGPPIAKALTSEIDDGGKEQSKNKYYQKIELNVGDHPALVQVGDHVLISSSDYEDDELHDKPANDKLHLSPVNTESRSAAVRDMMKDEIDDDNEEDEVLNSTLRSEQKIEVAMNSLDPYIGRVEEMWEEPKSSEKHGPFSKMKYRVRWFFKVCENSIYTSFSIFNTFGSYFLLSLELL